MNKPTDSENREEADILDHALASINRLAEQQEPSPEILDATLARVGHAAQSRPSFPKQLILRITTMTFTQKIAAAIALTLGGLTLWFALSLFGGFSTITYAQVADVIRNLHTATWNETVSGGNIPTPVTMKSFCLGGRYRMESNNDHTVMIQDTSLGKSLVLNGLNKSAQLIEIQSKTPPSPMQDMAAYFRGLADQHGEPIEDRQINGVTAKGFRTESFGFPTSLWVDPKTKLPLIVESTVTMGNQQMKVVMSDFVFDAPLDESLFSLTPPAGYTMTQGRPLVVDTDVEHNVLKVLRFYSARKNGAFPASLTDTNDLIKVGMSTMKNGQMDDESMSAVTSTGALMGTMFTLKKGTDYDYTPDGVKLGDSDKMLFWYHKKDAGTYRTIYGDLHAADVAQADLPIKP